MKKFKYLILFAALFLSFTVSVNAFTCEYSDGKLTAKFNINASKGTVGDATVNGTLESSDETKIKNEKQGIENWDSEFSPGDIKMTGKDYYSIHKDCPPYAIFVDRNAQFDFAVSTESYLDEFKEYGKSKQGYAIMSLVSSGKHEAEDPGNTEYDGGSCAAYTEKQSCEHNNYFSCIWNETEYGSYCNTDKLLYVSCGGAFDIPDQAPELISFAVNFLKILAPIILVVMSIISLVKAISSSNEDEMKKAQKGLVRKVIAAAMVFFIVSIVQFVIMKVADTAESDDISSCLSCFLNNDCENTLYYKTNVAGKYMCTRLETKELFVCQEENNKPSSTPQVKPENTTKPEEKPNNSGSDRVHGGGSV